MVARADVELLRQGFAAASTLAKRDLERYFAAINLDRPEMARDGLLEFMPALTDTYGSATAVVAADWYDEQRNLAGVSGSFRSEIAPTVPVEQVVQRVRFGAAHLFTEAPGLMLPFLLGITDKYVKEPGRQTLWQSAARDPARPRWARVPSGLETCDWCVMLASRGFVYHSEASARRSEISKFHEDCDCALVMEWSKHPRLEGYDPQDYYAQYVDRLTRPSSQNSPAA
ncbi:MAG: hypothetical protein Q4F67_14895 [Propionibacteriaceae bacterium]|nr:hypothetical protein [Propionibacteriaceae bacterium]